ncbi:MAG: pyridoxal phosphate-dependent aminotransferase [Deltaproteobacteria bacterium]|nr:pyridoxal phosphate-dependent aminotransferase [Deltaproteobacteria bacterium]MBW2019925.1 pyridoxal phosphate-dependent aminotransferase [Deltaproteobacteria bacterium]MBW2074552.1 pyridoxal phosphate-dependent aminotransferase [Deltaproteobacteria bacterium]RLB81253.1 MAG: aspartate aminotransferase [Deltaproteobacteria bacterium]
MPLSERIKRIKPSPTLAMNAKALSMRAAGIDVISFGVGEPDFDTPKHIREEAVRAMEEGFTRYTAVGGIPELKDAIIEKFRRDNNLTYERDEIMVSCGGKHVLYNLAQALLNPGDEVIIPAPYWVSYPPIVILAGAEPVIVQTTEAEDFKLSPESLEAAITPRTKLLILNSPSNPTGSVYTQSELEALAEVILRHNIWVVSDEIYEKLIFDDRPFYSIAQVGEAVKSKAFIVNGLSKSYAMTGWRIGYVAGAREIIAGMTKIQSQSTSNPNSIAQRAAVSALNGPQNSIQAMVQAFDERRKYLVQRLNAMPGVHCNVPGGAFYAFPNFSYYFKGKKEGAPIKGSAELCEYLLTEARVALVPGIAFGDEKFVRFSYATGLEAIKEGLNRIEEALHKLV